MSRERVPKKGSGNWKMAVGAGAVALALLWGGSQVCANSGTWIRTGETVLATPAGTAGPELPRSSVPAPNWVGTPEPPMRRGCTLTDNTDFYLEGPGNGPIGNADNTVCESGVPDYGRWLLVRPDGVRVVAQENHDVWSWATATPAGK